MGTTSRGKTELNIQKQIEWLEYNNSYLNQEMDKIELLLEKFVSKTNENQMRGTFSQTKTENLKSKIHPKKQISALETLSNIFGLTNFEKSVLLLCIAIELRPKIMELCSLAQKSSRFAYPTFGLALKLIPDSHWSAITPMAPLRKFLLIEFAVDELLVPVTQTPIIINERVLHYVRGIAFIADELRFFVKPFDSLSNSEEIETFQLQTSQILMQLKALPTKFASNITISLWGKSELSKKAIAKSICNHFGIGILQLDHESLPAQHLELKKFHKICARESLLLKSAFYIKKEIGAGTSTPVSFQYFVNNLPGIKIISTEKPYHDAFFSPYLSYEVVSLSENEQMSFFDKYLDDSENSGDMSSNVFSLLMELDDNYFDVKKLTSKPKFTLAKGSQSFQIKAILELRRKLVRDQLSRYAQLIIPKSRLDDLVLPSTEKELLNLVSIHVKQKDKVYREWGFEKKNSHGLGITVLFSGESGTGKTMAAEALANDLEMDLFRIDLSTVIDKYIGETEKNLKSIFDNADNRQIVLFFDEADALFGKRSDIKDSHDRYANIEVGYLLQRMEDYRGLAILATNFKNALDNAFMRRIRFIINFPFPSKESREEIWKNAFPHTTPTFNLDTKVLSQLNITGGHIRNIALNASFLAASKGTAVTMEHIKQSAQIEYSKMDKPLSQSELAW